VDLKQGKLFGALATTIKSTGQPPGKATGMTPEIVPEKYAAPVSGGTPLPAGARGRNLVSALDLWTLKDFLLAQQEGEGQEEQPWWQTAQAERTRVQVDMPWGVAGIRGTVWMSIVTEKGSTVTLLTGSATISGAGQSVSVTAGQSTQVAPDQQPSPPAPMTPEQNKLWTQVAQWVTETVQNIQANQPVPAAPPPPVDHLLQQTLQQVVQTILSSQELVSQISNALSKAVTESAAPVTGTGTSTSDDGGSSRDITPPVVSAADPAAGAAGVPLDKNIALTFSESVEAGDNFGSISLKSGNTALSAIFDLNGNSLKVYPVGQLAYDTAYTLTIPAGSLKDAAGNILALPYTLNFTTTTGDQDWVGWEYTGLWNLVDSVSGVRNGAAGKYVGLPQEDNSGGYLPLSPNGRKSFWYGLSSGSDAYSVGNYVYRQAGDDQDWSGGTSMEAHSGILTSPVYTVPGAGGGSMPLLKFSSWWEIESAEPADYDLMEICVVKDGVEETLARLNPTFDPAEGSSELPFTSGGFDQPGVWKPYALSLETYQGDQVRIRFKFATVDEQYNGFRGWLVSGVSIQNEQSGKISGTVTYGAEPVSGAEVRVTMGESDYRAVTGEGGAYTIDHVPPGSGYTITAFDGENSGEAANVSVTAGQTTANVNIDLVVADTTGPEVALTDPYDGAVGVALDPSFILEFDEGITEGGNFDEIGLWGMLDGQESVISRVYDHTIEGISLSLSINPEVILDWGSSYAVKLPAGAVQDLFGNESEDYSFSFTTVEAR